MTLARPRPHISRGPSRLSAWPTGTGTRRRTRNSPSEAPKMAHHRPAGPRRRNGAEHQLHARAFRPRGCEALEPPAGSFDHRRRHVHRDHPAAREALEQRFGDAPRAAARIEHELIASQRQAREHAAPELLHRGGDAVVARSVPCPRFWHTFVRYHVCLFAAPMRSVWVGGLLQAAPAPAASSPITRDSCPPCQASGELPGSSTSSGASGISRA